MIVTIHTARREFFGSDGRLLFRLTMTRFDDPIPVKSYGRRGEPRSRIVPESVGSLEIEVPEGSSFVELDCSRRLRLPRSDHDIDLLEAWQVFRAVLFERPGFRVVSETEPAEFAAEGGGA